MEYRSIADLNQTILDNLHRVPRNIDLVVGIPRSGLLAANILALHLNLPLTDVDGLVEGRLIKSGKRIEGESSLDTTNALNVLVLDDSIQSGRQLAEVKARVNAANLPHNFVFGVVYASVHSVALVDLSFEIMPGMRVFEWNMMHHNYLQDSCVDIDGVLCSDPTEEQNDDGPKYAEFLANAEPLFIPSVTVGWLVTCRLEKYRDLTEQWLAHHGVHYKNLVMMDLPSKAARVAAGSHGKFKAKVYSKSGARLFIESSASQAHEIAIRTDKPVFCIETRRLEYGDRAAIDSKRSVIQQTLGVTEDSNYKMDTSTASMSVSVIIVVDGAEGYVRRAVESALEQPETGEVVLVQDTSSGGELEVCKELAREFSNVRLQRQNNGKNNCVAAARNLGIREASCDYIAFLDADGFFLPGRFSIARRLFASDSQIEGVYEAVGTHSKGDGVRLNRQERKRESLVTMNERVRPERLFEKQSPIGNEGNYSVEGLVVKRSVFDMAGLFDERLSLHYDSAMFVKLAGVAKMVPGRLDEPVAICGGREENAEQRTSKEFYNDRILMWLTLWKWGKTHMNKKQQWIIFKRFLSYARTPYNRQFSRFAYRKQSVWQITVLFAEYPELIGESLLLALKPSRIHGLFRYLRQSRA